MEYFFLTEKEHQTLKQLKPRIERHYDVKILMPEVCKSSSNFDNIFIQICGTKDDIENVKDIITGTSGTLPMVKQNNPRNGEPELITISDSDDEISNKVTEPFVSEQNFEQSINAGDFTSNLNTSFCPESCLAIEKDSFNKNSVVEENTTIHRKTKRKKLEHQHAFPTSVSEITSTTDEMRQQLADARHIQEEDIIILDNCDIEQPLKAPGLLRPVVIDGSNVARAHGLPTKTFSSIGIKLTIEYFVNRGHNEVYAFIPRSRRYSNWKNFPTIDHSILDDLISQGYLCLTPTRYMNGKQIASYDDRFVLDLATRLRGVVVSNDSFKDLICENEAFRETVENRLVTYAFAGDHFMPAHDPLGRNGPFLDEILLFPSEENNAKK